MYNFTNKDDSRLPTLATYISKSARHRDIIQNVKLCTLNYTVDIFHQDKSRKFVWNESPHKDLSATENWNSSHGFRLALDPWQLNIRPDAYNYCMFGDLFAIKLDKNYGPWPYRKTSFVLHIMPKYFRDGVWNVILWMETVSLLKEIKGTFIHFCGTFHYILISMRHCLCYKFCFPISELVKNFYGKAMWQVKLCTWSETKLWLKSVCKWRRSS